MLAGKSDGSVVVAGRGGDSAVSRGGTRGRSLLFGGGAAQDSLQAQMLRSCGKVLPRKSVLAGAPAPSVPLAAMRRGGSDWLLPTPGEATRSAVRPRAASDESACEGFARDESPGGGSEGVEDGETPWEP